MSKNIGNAFNPDLKLGRRREAFCYCQPPAGTPGSDNRAGWWVGDTETNSPSTALTELLRLKHLPSISVCSTLIFAMSSEY